MDHSLDELLAEVAGGRLSAADAAGRLRGMGYAAVGDFARLDVSRAARKGVPEVVLAEGKSEDQVVAIVGRFLDHSPVVLCSRVTPAQAAALAAALPAAVVWDERSRVVTVRRADAPPPQERGVVGVLAAGTSDLGVAGEAVAMCRAMDVGVISAFDVGVAGLHRLAGPLDEMGAAGVAAVVVAAGMEGALPSVVCGLVDVPVIGLPTSTGYGLGGRGEAALLGMLQSCSPGLVAVNIDNGIGAGATAALIARRAT
ncbi:MAG: nickel pincer cofactor biosynthesis protein LarB [Thermoleophilia bacterium]